ncbi:hypothetical protein BD414DRAFT_447774 [Trametes punicea]|nr:hypothetical protein BD414DRAFT_447774 [Trametes punicea]
MSSNLVTVDDSDTASINYLAAANGDDWIPILPPNNPNVWDGDLTEAASVGLSAIFTFTGSQVFVYGRIQPPQNGDDPPLSLYSVGDITNQAFVAPTVNATMDNVSFFNSTVMPYGRYTLTINVVRASSNSPYLLDYIQYNITDPNASSPSAGSTAASSSGAAVGPTSAHAAIKSSSSPPVGPIVGGVVAAVVVIAAAVIALLCCCMRKRRPIYLLSATDPATDAATHITPYMVSSNAASQSRLSGLPSTPYSPTTREIASTYSLGASAGEGNKGHSASKAQRAAGYQPGYSVAGSASAGSIAGDRSAYSDGASGMAGAPSGVVRGTTHSHTHSSSMSSVHDLPNFVPKGQGHTKSSRSESESPLRANLSGGSAVEGGANAQEDSGLRFQPGVTPSDVAPVLPPGVMPIRSMATVSEVARADIPPAYTPN